MITAPAVALAILSGVAAPVAAASNVEARSYDDDYGHGGYGYDDNDYGHGGYGNSDNEYGNKHSNYARGYDDDHYGGGYDDYSHGHGYYDKRAESTVETVTKTIVITDPTQWSGLFQPKTTAIVSRDAAQTITVWGGDSQTVILPSQVTVDTTQVSWASSPTTVHGSSGGSSQQQQQGGFSSHDQSSGGKGQGGGLDQTWHNANTAGFGHGGGGGGYSGAASAKGVAWTGLALAGLGAAVAAL